MGTITTLAAGQITAVDDHNRAGENRRGSDRRDRSVGTRPRDRRPQPWTAAT